MYKKLFLFLVAFSLFVSACGGTSATISKSDLPRINNPEVTPSNLSQLTADNNAFGLDLFTTLRGKDGNLVFSPYSISLALAMTYAGARSQTESQMASTLHFTLPQTDLHPAFNGLDQELGRVGQAKPGEQTPLELSIANAVWAEQTFHFLPAYLDLIAQNYGAGIEQSDFMSNPDAVRNQINNWTSDRTNNKIKDLLPPGIVNRDTKMILVNAIYFKGDWQDPFDPNSTQDSPFTALDGTKIQVKMMNQSLSDVLYYQGSGYQAIELAYQGGSAAMDIIVPDQGKYNDIESTLNNSFLNNTLAGMQPTTVQLGLPKYSFTSDFNLSDPLAAMGMPDAFDPQRADFSGMTGGRDLFIENVVHKAFVAVDEKGTEAAAASAVIMAPASAMLQNANLTIDRPFIFIIRDTSSKQILFIGRVLDPSK